MNNTEELNPNGIDKILCVKVGKYQRENFYEMARKYWKVSLSRVSKATHVLAVTDGIVKAVYIPHEETFAQRLVCILFVNSLYNRKLFRIFEH